METTQIPNTNPTEIRPAPPYQLTASRHGTMLANPNDLFMGLALLIYGECCELEVQFLLSLLRLPSLLPGLIIEVGANMGIHTIPIAKHLAAQGRTMLALEPQPVIFQQLCANLALNGLMNVTALPYACGTENGAVSFEVPDYRSPGNFGGTAMCRGSAPSSHHQTVQGVRLDDLVPDGAVGLIKIDVEGHELQVLQGSQQILERCHPILYVENDRADRSPPLIHWLFDHGYRLWWHTPHLFNPNNFRHVSENHYGETSSINMLCISKQDLPPVTGLVAAQNPLLQTLSPLAEIAEILAEILDPRYHPTQARA